ncbi:NAD(P)-binding domain-containing protein, partial [Acetomicrobium sp.]|uniref:NAD(P)-binding domain-containing protein n=1 Tax=Acetomicrobium sp. TaxID=1872099 RepID=UPI0031587138
MLCSSVGIVGLGLIGGSMGKGLLESRSVDRVLGWDVDGNVLEYALSSKAITSIASPEETVEETELLIIATPPSKMTALSKTLAPLAGKN